ncbi:N-acetylmuramoyl-L-alanine amidase [Acuticoccus mangrovi]|uniref:N-acetylmuramoyl-L-alanine amidase n=1 Tax=Acuticoccus mangrovi TaxID=2796142 RepID=A0A934IJB4_9HYPH|nr:N-acetylmuramoyl-L-alanine amidase [Acuticoccus mangrovi]MBJ3774797.1 N-acetylmuramoyl-L-alanine amidase [Acuticoccus mangrovi]
MVTARLDSKILAIVLVMFAALAAMAGRSASAAEAAATSASFTSIDGGTRFTLELSEEPVHRIFAVEGPPRLVVDLDHVTFDIAEPGEASGLVSAYRFGALTPSSGRIVFDLKEPALITRQFYLPSLAGRPGRLVLDLASAAPERFALAASNASAAAEQEEPGAPAKSGPVVVIDPGHGGIDPGAITEDGIEEKDVALAFAKRLRKDLERIPNLTVRLTRNDDRFLSLNRRIRIARAYGADLFVSIHADAAPQDYVHGSTIYTLSERPSDAEAAALAARENLADSVSGSIEPQRQEEVSSILADLLRRETKSYSFEFAEHLITQLGASVRMNSNAHRYARFRVLMAHDIPSVLLELGYLTNAEDTRDLLTEAWQVRASASVAQAVADFFAINPVAEGKRHASDQGNMTTR